MGSRFNDLSPAHCDFINAQKIYFVGTAIDKGRVNISPKGMDSLRVLSPTRIIWLNVTGSGNESAAHVQINPRMTLMFCAFEGEPLILRTYGQAKVIHKKDAEWDDLYAHFTPHISARQIFDLSIDCVQSSCGMAVPCYDYQYDRDQLTKWAEKKGEDGVKSYWHSKNQHSIDGVPTHIVAKNG
jgi:Pyridoxamine 5'-phosphate oxidase